MAYGSGDDKDEEDILYSPLSRIVCDSLPSRGQKKRHLRVLHSMPGWSPSNIPDVWKHTKEINLQISLEYAQNKDHVSQENMTLSLYHGHELPMVPYSTSAHFGVLMVDYAMFPFNGNPLAPICFPCTTKPLGGSEMPDPLTLLDCT